MTGEIPPTPSQTQVPGSQSKLTGPPPQILNSNSKSVSAARITGPPPTPKDESTQLGQKLVPNSNSKSNPNAVSITRATGPPPSIPKPNPQRSNLTSKAISETTCLSPTSSTVPVERKLKPIDSNGQEQNTKSATGPPPPLSSLNNSRKHLPVKAVNDKATGPPPPPPPPPAIKKGKGLKRTSTSNSKTNSKRSRKRRRELAANAANNRVSKLFELGLPNGLGLNHMKQAKAKTIPENKSLLMKNVYLVKASEYGDYTMLLSLALTCKMLHKALIRSNMWKYLSLQLLQNLNEHIAPVSSLAKLKEWVFTASHDGKIKVWNSKTWKCVKTMNVTPLPRPHHMQVPGKNSTVGLAQTKPNTDKSTIKTTPSCNRNSVKITPLAQRTGEHFLPITALATSEYCLFIGCQDGSLFKQYVIPAPGNKTVRPQSKKTIAHSGAVSSIAVFKGKVFTGGVDSLIKVWNLKTLEIFATLKRHLKVVCHVQVIGQKLFTASHDNNIHVWRLKNLTHDCVLLNATKFQGENKAPNSLKKNTESQTATTTHDDRITSMTHYESQLYTASWDCYIKIWSLKTLDLLRQVYVFPVGVCWSLAVRQFDGLPPCLVCGVRDGDIEIRTMDKLKLLSGMECSSWASAVQKHKGWVTSLLTMSDGTIVSASDDWCVKVWTTRSNKLL